MEVGEKCLDVIRDCVFFTRDSVDNSDSKEKLQTNFDFAIPIDDKCPSSQIYP